MSFSYVGYPCFPQSDWCLFQGYTHIFVKTVPALFTLYLTIITKCQTLTLSLLWTKYKTSGCSRVETAGSFQLNTGPLWMWVQVLNCTKSLGIRDRMEVFQVESPFLCAPCSSKLVSDSIRQATFEPECSTHTAEEQLSCDSRKKGWEAKR